MHTLLPISRLTPTSAPSSRHRRTPVAGKDPEPLADLARMVDVAPWRVGMPGRLADRP